MTAHRQVRLIGALSDSEHLALALEFMDAEVGREYLREQGMDELLCEFERLSEESA